MKKYYKEYQNKKLVDKINNMVRLTKQSDKDFNVQI